MMENVDKYIASHSPEVQEKLNEIRTVLRKTLPDAEERISWAMPTFWKGKSIIHFAAFKNHIGLYPGDQAIETFKNELSDFSISKGTIRFSYDKEIPASLIERIAKWCYEEHGK